MTSESAVQASPPSQTISPVNCHSQIRLKNDGQKLSLILPPQSQNEAINDWSEMVQDLRGRLKSSEHNWPIAAPVYVIGKDRLLDGRQLQSLAEVLIEIGLELKVVSTSRRQTAVAAATAGYGVEPETPPAPVIGALTPTGSEALADPLYLQTTVRSGVDIRHPGTVIIFGDVNPGGKITAAGDILVWGCLRGLAHAGAQGNRECRIMALRLQPTQLRIADVVARPPENPPDQLEPEVAYITKEGIRITKAINFVKNSSISNRNLG